MDIPAVDNGEHPRISKPVLALFISAKVKLSP
jgi:hypothetical protein